MKALSRLVCILRLNIERITQNEHSITRDRCRCDRRWACRVDRSKLPGTGGIESNALRESIRPWRSGHDHAGWRVFYEPGSARALSRRTGDLDTEGIGGAL